MVSSLIAVLLAFGESASGHIYGTSILEKLYTILIPQFILHLNDGFIIPRKLLICHMHASEEKLNFFNKLKLICTVYVYGILPYT